MEKAAKFEKVSKAQFLKDWHIAFPQDFEEDILRVYDSLRLPQRATSGSAGYDFFAPFDIELKPRETLLVPTGIRVKMNENYVLMLFPRSSWGFKFRMQMDNTVGIIDSDYYHAQNQGHIFCKITNDTHDGRVIQIQAGDGMVQGVFVPFGITTDDACEKQRTGGIGSTTKAGK
jgi:dUTP pyrophosphatase